MWLFIFLGLAVPLTALSCARVLRHRKLCPRDRPGSADRGPLTLYEAAYLHRGRPGVAEVALTGLHLAGLLSVGDDGRPSPIPAEPGTPTDPVQSAALEILTTAKPLHLDELRGLVGDCPAATEVEEALVGRGLAIDPRLRKRAERTGLALVLTAATIGPVTVVACFADSLSGQGNGARPLGAFLVLALVTVVISRFAEPIPAGAHATPVGRRRGRETSVDETWAPRLAPGVAAPAALVRVAREGLSRHDSSAPLAAHLSAIELARPRRRGSNGSNRSRGSDSFDGSGCGADAGCGNGAGCGGGGGGT